MFKALRDRLAAWRQKAEAELKKLKLMSPMSAEATVSRNYLDWLIAVPWHKKTRESRDLGSWRSRRTSHIGRCSSPTNKP